MSIRLHARVKMRLPVRIRWMGSLGQEAEVCETKNVSRGGLLIACHEQHNEGFPLWVSFPFDRNAPDKQPEVLARVLRCKSLNGNSGGAVEMAVHFEGVPQANVLTPAAATTVDTKAAVNAVDAPKNLQAAAAKATTNGTLRAAAIPIRVRPESVPWFEEAITLEVSEDKIRFLSHREFLPGEILLVSFVGKDGRLWPGTGEIAAEIVGLEYVPRAAAMAVTLKRIKK